MRSESPYRAAKTPDGTYEILSATGAWLIRAKMSKKLAEQIAVALTATHEEGMNEVAADITESRLRAREDRAFAPHCDPTILHAPGKCEHCDKYPDWQAYRQVAQISFSGESNERGRKGRNALDFPYEPGIAPCPSTWFRDPAARDRWLGNRPDAGNAEGRIAQQLSPEDFKVLDVGGRTYLAAGPMPKVWDGEKNPLPVCWLCTRPVDPADLAHDGGHPVHRQCNVAVPGPKPSLLRRLLRGGR